ncbi:hypothetical protein GRX03_12405 [Halovenus sp. WSH3]|uniref:Phage-related replication protein n=1 Tax=Halovenus carboxidivorans TaxID=2692199 RepID=A0A6B0TAJ7_9EURY|nr:hypothetical protein [Halovenus carboxidivorans]
MSRRFISTQPVEVSATAHLIELLYDDGTHDETVICAGHGGAVEPGTAELAVELATATEDAVCWATLGYDGEGSAFERFHPPSTALGPDEYPLLGEIADRGFDRVLSLHGLADDEVLVGGATDDGTKDEIAERLDSALSVPVDVVTEGQYSGTHPENFVNWLAEGNGGIQLELGPTARSDAAETLRETLQTWLTEQ